MTTFLKQVGDSHALYRVGAVLLAAGEGSRLGNVPKCLLGLQGLPLIKQHMIALSGAGSSMVPTSNADAPA
jgi:CTP:molybdopterin cytidylyltransferase MocA